MLLLVRYQLNQPRAIERAKRAKMKIELYNTKETTLQKEILIALECILKMLIPIQIGEQDLLKAREKYLKSTIKRIEEVIKGA